MKEILINQQILLIKKPISIDDFQGDNLKCVVNYRGRCANFKYDSCLAENVNNWLDNLLKITTEELKNILIHRNISLKDIAEILEDEELLKVENIEEWVRIYNNQDDFLPIETIDRMMEINKNG